MKRVYINLVLCLFFCIGCQNPKQKQNTPEKSEQLNLKQSEYETKSGKIFMVNIDHTMGASICNVTAETLGFSENNTTHKLGVIDKVEKIKLEDLDNDGFEEIYIVTRSAGSDSYSSIYGIASNKDKSATPIYIRQISEKQKEKGEVFEGFMGHNQFLFEDNKLINSFPIYLEGDVNSKPIGGQKDVQYQLIAGEAGWILEPTRIIEQ